MQSLPYGAKREANAMNPNVMNELKDNGSKWVQLIKREIQINAEFLQIVFKCHGESIMEHGNQLKG